jgi:hypothetical protein
MLQDGQAIHITFGKYTTRVPGQVVTAKQQTPLAYEAEIVVRAEQDSDACVHVYERHQETVSARQPYAVHVDTGEEIYDGLASIDRPDGIGGPIWRFRIRARSLVRAPKP